MWNLYDSLCGNCECVMRKKKLRIISISILLLVEILEIFRKSKESHIFCKQRSSENAKVSFSWSRRNSLTAKSYKVTPLPLVCTMLTVGTWLLILSRTKEYMIGLLFFHFVSPHVLQRGAIVVQGGIPAKSLHRVSIVTLSRPYL